MIRSRAGLISFGGMIFGTALLIVGLIKTANTRSEHYAPLLFAGLIIGMLSTPFYYYFKAKDKQPPDYSQEAAMQALNAAGKNLAKDHQKQIERTKKDNT